MSGGYILLHRSLDEHHVFGKGPYCERMAWIWLLMQASYEPHKIRYHNKLIEVGRGDVPTSYRRLQEAWMWGVHRVRNFLALLEHDRMINRKTATGFLVLTICNYDKYQVSLTKSATHTTTLPTTHTTTNIIKGKERELSTKHYSGDAVSPFQKIYDAGSAVFPLLATANTSAIHSWIAAGCDPELDAIPEIQRLAEAGKPVRAWSYFSGSIMDAKATRTNPLPEGTSHAHNRTSNYQTAKPTKDERARAAVMRAAERLGFANPQQP